MLTNSNRVPLTTIVEYGCVVTMTIRGGGGLVSRAVSSGGCHGYSHALLLPTNTAVTSTPHTLTDELVAEDGREGGAGGGGWEMVGG